MNIKFRIAKAIVLGLLPCALPVNHSAACCAVGYSGKPVVNADQNVLIIWDAAKKKQHFIRKATFQSEGDDFAFLVPTPTRPELSESGDAAFSTLAELTAPKSYGKGGPIFPLGCSSSAPPRYLGTVRVIEEKCVAGFQATVLEADTPEVLAQWLEKHDYKLTSNVAKWAEPYIQQKWMITAMRVRKEKNSLHAPNVNAAALRISFTTDRPLFPYREPESGAFAKSLNTKSRTLKIYFVADKRYQAELDGGDAWTGQATWSRMLVNEERASLLKDLQLTSAAAPDKWHLTEFIDIWPYRQASGDLYFTPSPNQTDILATTNNPTTDPTIPLALAALMGVNYRRKRKRAR